TSTASFQLSRGFRRVPHRRDLVRRRITKRTQLFRQPLLVLASMRPADSCNLPQPCMGGCLASSAWTRTISSAPVPPFHQEEARLMRVRVVCSFHTSTLAYILWSGHRSYCTSLTLSSSQFGTGMLKDFGYLPPRRSIIWIK